MPIYTIAASQKGTLVDSKKLYYLKNRDKCLARSKQQRLANPDKTRAYNRQYAARNREKLRANRDKWKQNNPDLHKKAQQEWTRNNAGSVNANTKHYKLRKKQRCPKWLTDEQREQIKEFYIIAKELRWLSDEPLEVDHIVPLNGRDVSGLHVPWNLQILTKSENARKRNK